jgi:hypothetical protein
MPVILWGVLAVLAGALAVWIVALKARPRQPPLPPGTEFPATPLQKVARWSVGTGLLLGLAAAALVVVNGPRRWYEDDAIRITFTLLLLAVLGVFAAATAWMRAQSRREDGALDERDKAIFERAPAVQALAMLITLAVWIVGLAEHFHEAGAVPLLYLYLIFWSCLLVNVLGLPVGVLIGYRRR